MVDIEEARLKCLELAVKMGVSNPIEKAREFLEFVRSEDEPAVSGTKPLLSLSDAQEMLGIKQSFLFELLRSNRLRRVKVGRRSFVRRDEVLNLMEKGTSSPKRSRLVVLSDANGSNDPERYMRESATRHGIDVDLLKSHRKSRCIVERRDRVVVDVANRFPDLSLPKLGRLLNRDHTSVLACLVRNGAVRGDASKVITESV